MTLLIQVKQLKKDFDINAFAYTSENFSTKRKSSVNVMKEVTSCQYCIICVKPKHLRERGWYPAEQLMGESWMMIEPPWGTIHTWITVAMVVQFFDDVNQFNFHATLQEIFQCSMMLATKWHRGISRYLFDVGGKKIGYWRVVQFINYVFDSLGKALRIWQPGQMDRWTRMSKCWMLD